MQKRRLLSKPDRRPALRLALEQRIVFDGAIAVAGVDPIERVEPAAHAPVVAAERVVQERAPEAHQTRIAESPASGAKAPVQIAFVDAAVQDIQAFLPDFQGEVIALNADRDALAQIAAALKGRTDVAAIHIVSHGSSGELQIGNGVVNTASLRGAEHRADLAAIQAALTAEADILIYGCDVAAGEKGQAFIDTLAQATGADVAASTDTTGSADLGGNWDLEAHTAAIEANGLVLKSWNGALAFTNTAVGGPWTFTNAAANTAALATTAVNTTDGIKTTVTLSGAANVWTTTAVGALNNIAAFSNAAQNTADFTTVFNAASGVGVSGTVTITFDKAVINPIIHVDRIGGVTAGGLSNTSVWTLTTPGATLTKLAGPSHLLVTGTTFQRQTGITTSGTESSLTSTAGTAAGSMQIAGTYTSLTFSVTGAADGLELAFALDGPTIAVNDSFGTPHDTAYALNVRANDSDPTNDALTVTQVNGTVVTAGGAGVSVTGGSVALTAGGDLRFTPTAGFVGATSFSYTITDPIGNVATATVNGTVTEIAPVVDLNSTQVATERVVNGGFTGGATGWAVGGVAGTAASNVYYWSSGSAAGNVGTLTQAGITGWDNGYGTNGAAQITFGLGWNNSTPDSGAAATFEVSVGGVTYARFTTNADNANGSVGSMVYLNGASGPVSSVTSSAFTAWTYTPITINLPGNVAATGDLVLRSSSGANNGQDDLAIDNVSVLVRVDSVAGNNYSTTYTENGAPLSIAAATSAVRDNDDANLVSATIVLTNAQAGDALSVIGSLPAGITASAYNAGTGTLTLSGSASVASYSAAIRAIGFASSSENPATTARIVNVTVNDGLLASATSTTTIAVVRVNDAPVAIDDSFTTAEDTAVTIAVRANDTDVEGDTLSVGQVNGTAITAGGAGVAVTGGVVTLTAAGTLVFTPSLNYNGSPSFTYTVVDPGGLTSTATVSGTVTPVNDVPVAVNDTFVGTEDTPATIAVRGNDTDVDGDTLTVTQINGAAITAGGPAVAVAGGSVTLTVAGTLVFTPAANFNGAASFSYTVADPSGTTSSATVSGSFAAVNDAPVAANDSFTTAEDTAATIAVRTNDTDLDGDALSVTQVNGTAITAGGAGVAVTGGVVTLTAIGTLVFTPTANYNGPSSFTYTVADPGGLTSTATVSGTVVPVNDAPVAGDDTFTTAEDTVVVIDVRANDTDPEGDTLTITQVNGTSIAVGGPGVAVAGGSVTLNGAGKLVFTPNANYNGPTAFTYTVADASGAAATATVTGSVSAVNDAPVAVADAATTNENTASAGNALGNDSDVDLNTLTVSAVNGAAGGVGMAVAGSAGGLFTLQANGSYAFAPNGAFEDLASGQSRTSSIAYTVSDGAGGTATATITVTVTGVNDAPAAVADAYDTVDTAGVPGGLPLSGSVLANDSDAEGTALVVSAVNGAAGNVAAPVAGSFGTLTLKADGTFAYSVDRSNPVVQVLLRGQPALVETFTYTASDGQGGTATTTLTITIHGTNDSPEAGNDANEIAQGEASASGNVISGVHTTGGGNTVTVPGAADTDPNGDALRINEIRLPSQSIGTAIAPGGSGASVGSYGTLTIDAAGNYVYALNNASPTVLALVPGQSVTDTFVYTLTDGGSSIDATVTVVIGGINDAPIPANDSYTAVEDTPVTIDVRANDTDPDADPLTVTAINGSAITAGGAGVAVTGGVVTLTAAGVLVFTPTANYNGPSSFSYTVSDPLGLTATATVSGSVTPVNDAPVATNDTFSGTEDTASTLAVRGNDTDVDGDTLTVTKVDGQAITAGGGGISVIGGTITLTAAGTLVFTPNANYNGTTSFDYTVADPSGRTATATVAGTIAAVNDAPVAAADTFTATEDTPVTLDVRANDSDVDGDAFTVTQVNGSAITAGGAGVTVTGGVVTLTAAGALVFTPTAHFNGPSSFTYTVADPSGATASAMVSGTVAAVNDAPVASNDTFTGTEDTPATIDVRANDTDIDGDTLTVTQINGAAITAGGAPVAVTGGTVALTAAGTLVFTPAAHFNGAASFTYTVADPSGATSSASVSGSFAAVNDAPVAANDSFTTAEDTPVTIAVRANDTDIDGDTLTVTEVNGAAISVGGAGISVGGGVVTLDASGKLVFTPSANYFGAPSFNYTVADASGTTSTATVNGTVSPVSDPPTVNLANAANLLLDGDFDATLQPVLNGNNLLGASYGAFTSNVSINVIRVDGTPYWEGPDRADTGSQYVDLSPNGTLAQSFTLGAAQQVQFGASFSNRDLNLSGYDAPTTVVDILNSSGLVVATASALTLTRANGAESWFAVTGSATLTAGTYTYRVTLGEYGHVDSVYVRPGVNYATSYLENAAPVPIAAAGDAVFDVDSANLVAARIVLTNAQAGDVLSVIGSLPAGITASAYDPATGTITLSGNATPADYAMALRSVGFASASESPLATPRTVSVTVNDGTADSNTAVTTISVTPINDTPVATNDTYTGTEDTPVTIAVRANDTDADGDTLTVAQINGSAITAGGAGVAVTGGVVTLNLAGALVFTPTANFNGAASFDYTVADPSGATATATVSGSFAPVNDAPVAANDSFTATEDTPVTIDVRANDSDVDGDALSVTQVNGTAITAGGAAVAVPGGVVTLSLAGTLVFTPNLNFNGPTSFSYTVADPSGATATATVNGTVAPANDAPMAANDSFSGTEDTAATIAVRANDTDPEGDALSVTQINGSAITAGGAGVAVPDGVVTLSLAGALVFTPNANYNGVTSFTYTVADPSGTTSTATVTGTIAAVNDAPVAAADSFATAEETTVVIDVRANDSDVDGDTLTVTQVNGTAIAIGGPGVAATGGVVTLNGAGQLVYTPNTNFNGPTSFSYTVADPSGATATATVSGSVGAVNDAPIAVNDTATTNENTGTTGNALANDTDVDANPLTVSAVGGVAGNVGATVAGSFGGLFTVQADGSYTFAPNAEFEDLAAGQSRTSSIAYSVSDGAGGTASATITVTVTGVNDAPVAVADAYDTVDTAGVPGGLPLSGSVLANDTDVERTPLVVAAVNGSAANVASPVAGSYGTLTLNADGSFSYAVDRSNPTVVALLRGQPPLVENYTYTASDGQGGTATTTLTITINGTNDSPDAGNDSNAMSQGEANATGNVISGVRTSGSGVTETIAPAIDTDPNGDPIVINEIRLAGEASGAAVTPGTPGVKVGLYGTVTIASDGSYTYVLDNASAVVQALVPGQQVTDTFVYTLTDGGSSVDATITVVVGGTNDAPVAVDDSNATTENTPASGNVLANDTDIDTGATRVVAAVAGAAGNVGAPTAGSTGGLFTVAPDGGYTFNPGTAFDNLAAGATRSTYLDYTVSDGQGGFDVGRLTVTVTGLNDAPVAAGDSFTTTEDTPVTIDVRANDNDVDGDALTVTQVDGQAIAAGGAGISVAGGVVTLTAAGTLVFTPTADFNGAASFSYTVADPSGLTSTATVGGTVTPVNDAPVAANDTFSATEDTPVTIAVRGNDTDVDGDALSVTEIDGTPIAAGGPGVAVIGGVVTLNAAGALVFTPSTDYTGPSTFTYTVADPSGLTSTASVSGSVAPVNDAPVATDDTFSATEDAAVAIAVRANDGDADGDALTVTQVNGAPIAAGGPGVAVTGGVVTLNAAGELVFTPTAHFNGPTSFGYTVADPSGATATATVTGTTAAVNDAPVAAADTFTATEDTPVTIDVRANDSDADGDVLTVTQINGTAISVGDAGVAVTGGVVTLDLAGTLVFTPNPNYNGPLSFVYTVADPSGATATASVSGTVAPVNDAPVAATDTFAATEDTPVTIDVRANDSDAEGGPLTVTQINGQPISAGGAGVAVTGGVVTLTPAGVLVFVPSPNYHGPSAFNYTVSDASGASATASVSGSVASVNDAPVATADTFTATEDTPVTIAVRGNDSDADGDVLTVTHINGTPIAIGGPGVAVTGGVVTLNPAGNLVFTPAPNYNGPSSFSYTVADPSGVAATAAVNGRVAPVNDTPVATADTFTATEDVPLTIDVRANDTDADGDVLTVTQINGSAIAAGGTGVAVTGGVVTLNAAGQLVYTPAPNYSGPAAFSYTVADASGGIATAAVNGSVAAVNDAPTATDDIAEFAGSALTIDVLGNDTDTEGERLGVTAIDGVPITAGGPGVPVAGGVVTLQVDGRLLYTPDGSAPADRTFTYTARDASGASATATVRLIGEAAATPSPATLAEIPHPRFTIEPRIEPALFVLASVNESRSALGLGNDTAAMTSDVVTIAEVTRGRSDDLSFAAGESQGRTGLIGRDTDLTREGVLHAADTLFVQHAVRHEGFAPNHALFVQGAVRTSQIEAKTLEMRAASMNSAAPGTSTLFDPFALGAPAVATPERTAGAAEPAPAQAPATRIAERATEAGSAERDATDAPARALGRDAAAPKALPTKRGGSPGFAAQLKTSAGEFRARTQRASAPAGAGTAERVAALPAPLPVAPAIHTPSVTIATR